jgi:hypothetical protein
MTVLAAVFGGIWTFLLYCFYWWPMIETEVSFARFGASEATISSYYTLWGIYHEDFGVDGKRIAWEDTCDDKNYHDRSDTSKQNRDSLCSKVYISTVCVFIGFGTALAASIGACVQGCCCTTDRACCAISTVVNSIIAWFFTLLAFAIWAAGKGDIDAGDTENRFAGTSTNYHAGFFLGLIMVLSCAGTIVCAFMGCRQIKAAALPAPSAVAQPAVVVGAPVVQAIGGKQEMQEVNPNLA